MTGSMKRVTHNAFGKQHGNMEGVQIPAPRQLGSNAGSAAVRCGDLNTYSAGLL